MTPETISKDSTFQIVIPPKDSAAMFEAMGDAIFRAALETQWKTGPDALIFDLPDGQALVDGQKFDFKKLTVQTTFFRVPDGLACFIADRLEVFALSDEIPDIKERLEGIEARNTLASFELPFKEQTTSVLSDESKDRTPRRKFPSALPYPTFSEARAGAWAISDARDGRNWRLIEGTIAAFHAPKSAAHQVRFEPNDLLVAWWGKPLTSPEKLWDELKKMDMDSVMLYQVTLANILFDPKARFTTSLDELIKAIGRDGEAKRSAQSRAEWRQKTWRTLLLFDSLAVIGARNGTWREPGSAGEPRAKMPADKLVSRDPLFRIIGTRETEQGSFDNSEPPKEVSLVPGEWLMQFHGNREMLSDFGDVLKIAAIPRGKAAGNWAACIGLMLTQLWRERAAKATRKRAGSAHTLDFGTFTRRQLLAKTLRSDHDVDELLNDPEGRGARVRAYWQTAIQELKNAEVVGHYAEADEPKHHDWRERWLDQPLDIRPKSAMKNALEINSDAAKARARTTRKTKKAPDEKSAD